MALLEATNLSKSFGGVHAVDGLSIEVQENQIVACIGPNGAGKSTLFNVLTGVHAPDRGAISFAGGDITGLPPHVISRRGLARTFQKIRLFKRLTVLHNVVIGFHPQRHVPVWQPVIRRSAYRREAIATEAAAMELLDFVGLADVAMDEASTLPYGRQRLLEIARALATGPKVLLLDEPAAGLNSEEATKLVAMLRLIRDRGTAQVVVEHNMDLVMTIADRITVMMSGAKLFEGTPAEVQAAPEVIEAYLGEEDLGAPADSDGEVDSGDRSRS